MKFCGNSYCKKMQLKDSGGKKLSSSVSPSCHIYSNPQSDAPWQKLRISNQSVALVVVYRARFENPLEGFWGLITS